MSNDTQAPPAPATGAASPSAGPRKRKAVLLGITALFLLAGLAWGAWYLLVGSKRVSTDNAYVGGNLVTVTAQINGSVIEIGADETQRVQAGAPLVKLDPTDADVALNQAEARLGAAVRQQRERYLGVDQARAVIAEREVALRAARSDLARRLPLAADHTVSGEDVAHARQAIDTAGAALAVARQQLSTASSAVAGVQPAMHPAVLAARADYIQAWLAARRTTIAAPVSGYVARRGVQLGARVAPGTPLLAIVPLDQLWVDANFKESELRDIRIGQPATIEADMYGGKVTFHGTVAGLSAGTGSAFSLLPAQNASGNWIKVVQRLPVRITLDPKELAAHPLRVGLSATVDVDIARQGGGVLGAPVTGAASTSALTQPVGEAQAAADAIIARNLGAK